MHKEMSQPIVGKIYPAMIAIMRDIEAIGKDQRNQSQGFNFRGIDQMYNELHGLMAKHGVITLPIAGDPKSEERITNKGGVLRFVTVPMTYRFMAEDGSCVDCQVIGEGMDSGDKATNKAMAIGHKYALLQTFLIPTQEIKDPDGDTFTDIAPKKGEPTFTGANHRKLYDQFLEAFINPSQFLEAMKAKGELPEKASDFFKMGDATASKFLDRQDEIEDAIKNLTVTK